MKIDTALNHKTRLIERLRTVFWWTENGGYSFEQYLEEYKKFVNTEPYTKVPRWLKSWLSGYHQALYDRMTTGKGCPQLLVHKEAGIWKHSKEVLLFSQVTQSAVIWIKPSQQLDTNVTFTPNQDLNEQKVWSAWYCHTEPAQKFPALAFPNGAKLSEIPDLAQTEKESL